MEERKISPLKRERFIRGIKQKDLSFETGICQSAISKYEAERWIPNEKDMRLIADALEVPIKKIFPSRKR